MHKAGINQKRRKAVPLIESPTNFCLSSYRRCSTNWSLSDFQSTGQCRPGLRERRV